jgi:hypothetical protein
MAVLARPLIGFGIAASVAVAAIVGLRLVNDARVEPSVAGSPLTASTAAAETSRAPAPAPSYVVPQEVSDSPLGVRQIRLTNYLVHHGEYASRLSRTSVHSNVVGASKPIPEAVVQPASSQRPAE